jgi:hypothetical protein
VPNPATFEQTKQDMLFRIEIHFTLAVLNNIGSRRVTHFDQ